MNVSLFALLFCILIWPSQSQDIYNFTFTTEHYQSHKYSDSNYTATTGSSIKFYCKCKSDDTCLAEWYKESCQIAKFQVVSKMCKHNDKANCVNMTKPSNFTCDTKNSIMIHNVTVEDSGEWYCKDGTYTSFSARHIVIVNPAGTTTHQMDDTSTSAGSSVKWDGLTTTRQLVKSTRREAASNNVLFLPIGVAVGGVLVITLLAVVVVVKRKKSHKGGRASEPPNDDKLVGLDNLQPSCQFVPEVEVVDPDGQYESFGQMKPSVAVAPLEVNPMYESYGDNQNENQNQNLNQNQDGSISLAKGGEGDVYSVVNKPGRSTVQEAPCVVDTGGDVYSVVQKKQVTPTTDGRQAAATVYLLTEGKVHPELRD